jgi:hypothetical protein
MPTAYQFFGSITRRCIEAQSTAERVYYLGRHLSVKIVIILFAEFAKFSPLANLAHGSRSPVTIQNQLLSG